MGAAGTFALVGSLGSRFDLEDRIVCVRIPPRAFGRLDGRQFFFAPDNAIRYAARV